MIDYENLSQHLAKLASIKPEKSDALEILKYLDLTRLEHLNDDEPAVTALCQQALQLPSKVATLCVYPNYLHIPQKLLGQSFKLGTVVNFPNPTQPIETTLSHIEKATSLGANEIDMIFPYHEYLAGKHKQACDYVAQCKKACGDKVILKVILESGEFDDLELLYKASTDIIATGVNFIKTSSGKVDIGATLDAAYVMLSAIKSMHTFDCGFKASGGIKTLKVALQYRILAQQILGEAWVTSQHFRIGASNLVGNLVESYVHPNTST